MCILKILGELFHYLKNDKKLLFLKDFAINNFFERCETILHDKRYFTDFLAEEQFHNLW